METTGDNNIEMLEAFLDQQLSDEQRSELRARLVSDAALSSELERLRDQRQIRQAMFKSFEGGEEAVIDRALGKMKEYDRRRESRIIRIRRVFFAAAAAACIVIGFLVGWMGAVGGKSSTVSANELPYSVQLLDETGQTLAVQKFQTFEKAREFSTDLQQWQLRQDRLLSGKVTRQTDEY